MIVAQSAAAARAFAIPHHERVDVDADILGLAGGECGRRRQRRVRRQRQPDADRDGGARGRAQSGRADRHGRSSSRWCCCSPPDRSQYLPRCVLAGLVFTIAVGLIDIRGLADIRRESPGEFTLAVGHRGGGRADRRRAGHPARAFALSLRAACSPQLPAAHDGARARRVRSLGAHAGRRPACRRSRDLSSTASAPISSTRTKRGSSTRWSLVEDAPTPVRSSRRRRVGDHRHRLFRGAIGARPDRRLCARAAWPSCSVG